MCPPTLLLPVLLAFAAWLPAAPAVPASSAVDASSARAETALGYGYDPSAAATTLPANPRIDAPRGERRHASGSWSSMSPAAGTRATKAGTRGGAAPVRLGQAGEDAVRGAYSIGDKVPVTIGGRTRIPDGLTTSRLSEVKNLGSLSYSSQLRDYVAYAQQTGRQVDL